MRNRDNRYRGSQYSGSQYSWVLLTLLAAPASAGSEGEAVQLPQANLLKIQVSPRDFLLTRPRDRIQLVVSGHYAGGHQGDLTEVAEFTVSGDSIKVSPRAVIHPVKNGSSTVMVRVGKHTAAASIQVLSQSVPRDVSFANEVLPALSKQGCSAGACHGSPSGKGGFRLSLRGFDEQLDKLTLIREANGRRANPLSPDDSLLLLKPLMKVTHGGGQQLRTTDPAYGILRAWIDEGCQADPPGAERCVGIEVVPGTAAQFKFPAVEQRLAVLARYSDGSKRDITELAVFSTSDSEVATVSRNGVVRGHDRGEAAIIVRYLEFIESVRLTFVKEIDGYRWPDVAANNYVDEAVYEKLRQLQYLPAELSSDEEFLRRVYLDVTGLLPTIEETKAFLRDGDDSKRDRLIDDLLDRPEHARFWALKWGDLLRMTSVQLGDHGVHKYHRWVERAVRDNVPYDEFARQLLTASGSTLSNPPANFYRAAKDMNDCVETVSQLFLGARLQCAKCHNHPFERWTQDNYYGMGAFFTRLQRTKTRRPGEILLSWSESGEVVQPRTGKEMRPWVPVLGYVESSHVSDRRVVFANWLTDEQNELFARVEVNRIWSHLLGRGIVDPPDDFRESNPPSNAALLDALTADFVASGFDRRHILRTILKSRTYQLSAATRAAGDASEGGAKYFAHYQPRLLTAEQLLDAICHVTGMPEQFSQLPPGTKATQLPAPDIVKHDFLKVFGQPERQTVCQCERSGDSNLGMAIEFLNGELIHGKLQAQGNRFRSLADGGNSNQQIITSLYLAAVSRFPTEAELQAGLNHVTDRARQHAETQPEVAEQVKRLQAEVDALRSAAVESVFKARLDTVPEEIRDDTQTALLTAADNRSEVQAYLAEKFSKLRDVSEEELLNGFSDDQRRVFNAKKVELAHAEEENITAEEARMRALEDICWVLLNKNEFLFNH